MSNGPFGMIPGQQAVNVSAVDIVTALQNGVQAINALNQTIASVFPPASATLSVSAGAASGSYLVINVNGTVYKIQLLNV